MVQQLAQRPFSVAPADPGSNAQVAISPNGKWVLVFSDSTTPALYRWTGTAYVAATALPNAAGKIITSGAWSPDGAFLLLQAGTTLQLLSFNDSTGAAALLHDAAASRQNSIIRHFYNDYYVGIRVRVASGVIAEWYKHDRTANTLTRVAAYTSSSSSIIMAFDVCRAKRSLLIAWRNTNGNSVRMCSFNEANNTYSFSTTVGMEAGESNPNNIAIDVAASDDENYWYRVGNDQASRCRAGTISADGATLAAQSYNAATLGGPGTLAAFMFGSTAIFRGASDQGTAPYDTYNLFSAGDYAQNTIEVTPIANRTRGFGRFFNSGCRDKSKTQRKIWAFISQPSSTAPHVTVYQEQTQNDIAELVAMAPMADAFARGQIHESMTAVAVAPMGDAILSSVLNDTARLNAAAPMADATADLLQNEAFELVADAPMADARANMLVNYQADLIADVPMADARVNALTDRQADLVADVPMASAVLDVPVNLIFDGAADAPMAFASISLEAVELTLEALAPMSDAWIQLTDAQFIAEGCAPMSEAIFAATGSFVDALAVSPMADANFDIPNVNVQGFEGLAPMADALMSASTSVLSLIALAPMADAILGINNTYAQIAAVAPMADAQLRAQRYTTGDAYAIAPMANAILDTEMPVTTLVAQVPMANAFAYMGRQGRAAFSVFVIRKG